MGSRREGWRPWAAPRSDRGMVSAELAVAVPALIAVVLALAWLVGLGATQGVVAQAAREGARAAARGETSTAVRTAVAQLAPGARVTIRRSGRLVVVTAELTRTPPSRLLRPLGRDVRASATTWREQP